jgi:Flp pilus assembly protein TadD
LAELDPSNADWQRGLAAAHSRVGAVLQAEGKLVEAQAEFGRDLAINRRLAELDPSNAEWQRALAVAHSRVGDALQAEGKLAEAQAEFGEYLAISRRLAELDPSNAGRERELAVACVKIARLGSEVGTHTVALVLYEEASRIFGTLVKSGSGFALWAKEKEIVDSELTLCRTKV